MNKYYYNIFLQHFIKFCVLFMSQKPLKYELCITFDKNLFNMCISLEHDDSYTLSKINSPYDVM